MNILQLIYDDVENPWIGGGGARRIRELYTRLVRRGHQCTIVCGNYPGAAERLVDGVRYVHVGSRRSYVLSAATYVASAWLYLLRHGWRYDVVVEDFSLFCPVFAYPLARRPAVIQLQLYCPRSSFRKFGPLAGLLFASQAYYPRLYRDAIYLNESLASRWPRGRQRQHYVRMGIPERYLALSASDAACSTDSREPLVLPTGQQIPSSYFLYLGRLAYREKGLDVLRTAFERVCKDCHSPRLVIAGGGRQAVEARTAFAELEREHPASLIFTGVVDGPLKEELLARCRALVLPSREEGEGLCVLEAAAFGKPTIASDIGELQYVGREGIGVNVETGNATALANAMLTLWNEPALASQRRCRARAWAAQHTWEHKAADFEAALLAVVNRAASPSRTAVMHSA